MTKRAEEFMKDSSHVDAAEHEFHQRVKEAKQKGEKLSAESVRTYGRKHGWSTAKDEKIMDSVIRKEGISSNPKEWKTLNIKRSLHQQKVNQIMREGLGSKPSPKIKIHKKYY